MPVALVPNGKHGVSMNGAVARSSACLSWGRQRASVSPRIRVIDHAAAMTHGDNRASAPRRVRCRDRDRIMEDKSLQPPPLSLLDKYRGRDFHPLYTTTVTVSGGQTGHGRASGVVRSDDGNLDLELRLPREFGGPGNGTN